MTSRSAASIGTISVGAWLRGQQQLPRLDCELLVGHHLGIGRAAVIAYPERALTTSELNNLETDASRLADGEPLAYIIGEWEFWGLSLQVSPDVLIPRPETETLVELALQRLKPGQRVLDLGTGSGAIAIALATTLPLDMVATDSSPAALAVAARNAACHGARLQFVESDWFDRVCGLFHLIAANPPYVACGDPHLPALRHEPLQALMSGPEGLDDLKRIIAAAANSLLPGGWLLVEHGCDQGPATAACFHERGFVEVATHPDLAGLDRITLGRRHGA